ncbi:hypothetical protein ABK040_008919 [Willaertia magna]
MSKVNTTKIAEHYHGELPFTLSQLRQAIPEHCFKRSLLISSFHLILDIIQVVITFYLFSKADNWIIENFQNIPAIYWPLHILWLITYFIIQGTNFTSLWVLHHECGHFAFCENNLISDIVGYIVGTLLYVPYFAWQKSHAVHHACTGHMERDQVWVPYRILEDEKDQEKKKFELHGNSFTVMLEIITMSTIGWPLHLLVNISGPIKENVINYFLKGVRYFPHTEETEKNKDEKKEEKKEHGISFCSHFYPGSPIFTKSEAFKIHLSNVGIVAWTAVIAHLVSLYGGYTIMTYYFLPLIGNFFLLTTLTYLQHVDERVPHFDEGEWYWLKGAICTIDRFFGDNFWGRLMDAKLHHITTTHVCHHVFSKIPFYNAEEASQAMKKIMSGGYKETSNDKRETYDYFRRVEAKEESFFVSLYRKLRDCNVLKRDGKHKGILFWYNRHTQ